MQWKKQAGYITTNIKVKIYLTLYEFSTTKIITWECYLEKPAITRYAMILGRDILISLGLNKKLPNASLKQGMDI